MKKLNLNNSADGDDGVLINILKDSLGREPTEKLIENTLNKLSVSKEKKNISYKPLRFPLYLIFAIGLILIAPVFLTSSLNILNPYLEFELNDFFKNMSFQLDSWYTLSLIVLVFISTLVMWIELGIFKFRNPFV